jgi:endonuclease/exonuclease/phosphatase family metal-dependent hydrolase
VLPLFAAGFYFFAQILHIMFQRVLLGFLIISAVLHGNPAHAQEQYKVAAIGFYNCENLFDTINDPNKKDEDFTPDGPYRYTGAVYRAKLHNVASVFQQMGTDVTPDGPALIGLAEIENDNVLKDLVAQPEIAARRYQYAWFYTPDERGISTALLYNPKYLKVLMAEPLRIPTEQLSYKRPTRDVLHVCGLLAGDTVHILVNHWPSKSGGEAASEPGRKLAASVNKRLIDSLKAINPATKIIMMGDFNDNPTSVAITEVLQAKANRKDVTDTDIYNPWYNLYKKGIGTEIFRGEWNLIDQIMVSGALLSNNNHKWGYYKQEIFKREFLVHKIGNDKGLPHRSFTINQQWDNGYSDHFPVLVYLIEKK